MSSMRSTNLVLPFLRGAFAAGSLLLLGAAPVGGDPSRPLGERIDVVLDRERVGDLPLREALMTLRIEGCLASTPPGLTEGLDALRAVHSVAVESRRSPRTWAAFERKLERLPTESWLLVATWIDSPEAARRMFLCEDGLPPSWKNLAADDFLIEAVTWFDIAVAERDHSLRRAAPADREQSVIELMELRSALVKRFDATYPSDDTHELARGRLVSRLDLMWADLVEPYHTGFTPKARTLDTDARPEELQRHRPIATPLSGQIPDPWDVRAKDRVVSSWNRQRRAVDRDVAQNEDSITTLRGMIGRTTDPKELDRLAREAARLDAELGNLQDDLVSMQDRISSFSTGRSWIDGMLRNGPKRTAVRRLEKRRPRIDGAREVAALAVADAVARGAVTPGDIRPEGPRIPGDERPGPGNWISGLPGADSGKGTAVRSATQAAGSAPTGIPEGSGLVERRYEGPLPLPAATWSDDLVAAIRRRHPSLDDMDVRILLGLVQLAYRELPDRSSVERAVWRSLSGGEGLAIRGEEARLSEIWLPPKGHDEQPIVTFLLSLRF